MVGGVQQATSLVNIFSDSQTVYNEWIAGDYFQSGLYAGKDVINAFFTCYSLFIQYSAYF